MTDILSRLRGDIPHRLIEDHWTIDFEDLDAEREEAAAEIERLRKENGRLDSNNKELLYDNEQKFAEIQRLRNVGK
jgi:predicted nuclease with TOPRIM domain